MPVRVDGSLRRFGKDEFHSRCRAAVGAAFGLHNEAGNLLDEHQYQEGLAGQLRGLNFEARREVGITVQFGKFERIYRLDVLIDQGVIVEAKVVAKLSREHERQLLNYLFLCDLSDGLLLNFGSESVHKRFVSTHLRAADRRLNHVDTEAFHPATSSCERLITFAAAVIEDFGTRLNRALYIDAIIDNLDTSDALPIRRPIVVRRGATPLGKKTLPCLSNQVALAFTTFLGDDHHTETHLRRLLSMTSLERIHWLNLGANDLTIRTVRTARTSIRH